MVGRRYLCPVTGGEGGVGRLRGDLDLWRLGEALAAGRGERLRLAGVEVEFGTGGKGGDTGTTRAAVGLFWLSPGRTPGATAVLTLGTVGRRGEEVGGDEDDAVVGLGASRDTLCTSQV